MTPLVKTALVALLLVASAESLDATPIEVPALGQVDFPNSGIESAQLPFARGVLLLHSFEYEDAREAFQEARRLDPDFALAAWGEAMTHNHPLWRQQDREAGVTALEALAPTLEGRLAKAPTEREKGYLRAVETLYFGEGDKAQRDHAYERVLAGLAAEYPEDLEARAFWSLSILGTAQGERDFAVYMRAGAVAEEVFAQNPRHPGAAHYLIHSYDDPVHAPLGLRAARVYAEIAPAASHAQHMISHIFVALGRWQESVEANIKSYEVSVERAERKGLGVDAHNFHALHWLQYSYLQLGRFAEAGKLLNDMFPMAEESGSSRALWYYAAMRAGQMVETGSAAELPGVPEGDDEFGTLTLELFGDGWSAMRADETQAVRRAAEELRSLIGASRDEAQAEARGLRGVSENDRRQAEVLALELEALVALDAEDSARAVALLEDAAEIEGALPLEFGPPVIIQPSHEMLGEVLSDLGRPAEAMARFDEALERAPRRRKSLQGLAKAAAALGQGEVADQACRELDAILEGADETAARPEACRN